MIKKKNCFIPALKVGNSVMLSGSEKANALADEFLRNHSITNSASSNANTEFTVEQSVHLLNSLPTDGGDNYVSFNDVANVLSTLKRRKSAGFDGVKNLFIKNLPKIGIKYLQLIFNGCIRLGYFPNEWKNTKVIPILKPGKSANMPSSYRPISLLSSLSKCFEKIIKNKLEAHIFTSSILPPEQFGFRAHHNTVHQVHRITNHIKNNFALGNSTGMVLLDVEKAFDTVWHNGLLHKLMRYNFPTYLIKLIQSFLSRRTFKVSVNNWMSNDHLIGAGVPQGSVLAPILYNIYTSDFPRLNNCEFAMFADDTCIYTSDVSGFNIETQLQSALNTIQTYFTNWKIKINASKTQAVFFTRKRKVCFLPSNRLIINRVQTEWKSSAKYLGVHLDKTLTFGLHIQEVINKVNRTIMILYPFINRKSKLSNDNKLIIFKVIFQAIMFYGSPVWGKCAKSHLGRLQITQNKLLKMILKLPRLFSTEQLHLLANIELVTSRISKLCDRYNISCVSSDNNLIADLAT